MASHGVKQQKSTKKIGIIATDKTNRLSLGLRTLRFSQEMASMRLADDVKELLEQCLAFRQGELEARYNLVFAWTKLKQKGSFWLDMGYKTFDEAWSSLDLPMGATLAAWEVMVRLFSKETFILVGDTALNYMIRGVVPYQTDSRRRIEDYRQIFDSYCNRYAAFDKDSFYRHVNWYINTRYAEPAGLTVVDRVKRLPSPTTRGETMRRIIIEAEASSPIPADFALEKVVCAGCRERDVLITDLQNRLSMAEYRSTKDSAN